MNESFLDKAKASASVIKDKVVDMKDNLWDDDKKEIIDAFKDATSEKLKNLLETIGNYTSLFFEAGYELSSINVSITLPPDVSITFKCLDIIPVSERDNIFNKVQDSKVATLLLKSLFRASDYANTIVIGKFKLKSVNIALGLIPSVSISYS